MLFTPPPANTILFCSFRARENTQNQLKQQHMDHEEVMRQRHAAHEEAMRGANDVAQTRLRAELESSEAKAAAERDAALRRAVTESKRRADTIRSLCMKEKAEAMSKLQNEHNQVIAEITEAARIERKNSLDELSSRAKRELDHAVERVSEMAIVGAIYPLLDLFPL
jgi:acyl-CoA reductase-like NAD-dependent aldehyde dehydrogenase